MGFWEAIALAKRILERPWAQWALGFLRKIFDAPRPEEKKDEQGWTETGRKTFDSRLDPKD